MRAKAYDKKTAAFAGFVIQNISSDLDDETMDGWMNNPEGLKKFLSGLKPLGEKQPTLCLINTVSLGEVADKKTSDCMTGNHWNYRGSNIDRQLPAKQPALSAGPVGIYQLQNPMGITFREMAAAVLQIGSGTSLDLLAEALKKHGHTLTLSALEQLVERQENGEEIGLRTDGWANFAFVEDENGSVSVVRIYRRVGQWDAGVRRLGDDRRWRADRRLLVRNSDAVAL